MPLFQYVGWYDRMYGGHGVKNGDVLDLPEAPNDGMWVPVEDAPQNTPVTAPETAPAAPAEPSPVTVPEPVPAPSEAVSAVNPNTQPPAVVH